MTQTGKPLLLLRFQGMKEYSPMMATRQFGWSVITKLPIEYIDVPYKKDLVEQQRATKSWVYRWKVRESSLLELVRVLYLVHRYMKKKRTSEEPMCPSPENNLAADTMLIEGGGRIEDSYREYERRGSKNGPNPWRSHIRKSEERLISKYHDKAEGCKWALEKT